MLCKGRYIDTILVELENAEFVVCSREWVNARVYVCMRDYWRVCIATCRNIFSLHAQKYTRLSPSMFISPLFPFLDLQFPFWRRILEMNSRDIDSLKASLFLLPAIRRSYISIPLSISLIFSPTLLCFLQISLIILPFEGVFLTRIKAPSQWYTLQNFLIAPHRYRGWLP